MNQGHVVRRSSSDSASLLAAPATHYANALAMLRVAENTWMVELSVLGSLWHQRNQEEKG